MAQRICPKLLIISVALMLFTQGISYAEDYKRTVITDPNISRHCELLTEKRQEKINNKQRILGMIERNKHLQKITPENRISLKNKLEINLGHLDFVVCRYSKLTCQQLSFVNIFLSPQHRHAQGQN